MRRSILLHKAVGETPLACLEAYRSAHPQYAGVKMAYAGRLDPMASGKLLILIGEECKRQERYHGLDKEYLVEVLFGASSDTADVLGILTASMPALVAKEDIVRACRALTGAVSLPYPHYSAKPVHGKPLHTWALEGRIGEIEIPLQHSRIYRLDVEAVYTKTAREIFEASSRKIETIPPVDDPKKSLGSDFRRTDIRSSWRSFSETHRPEARFTLARVRARVSSGTYMRSLAEALGEHLSLPALAYSIERTQIGRYRTWGSWGFWTRRY